MIQLLGAFIMIRQLHSTSEAFYGLVRCPQHNFVSVLVHCHKNKFVCPLMVTTGSIIHRPNAEAMELKREPKILAEISSRWAAILVPARHCAITQLMSSAHCPTSCHRIRWFVETLFRTAKATAFEIFACSGLRTNKWHDG